MHLEIRLVFKACDEDLSGLIFNVTSVAHLATCPKPRWRWPHSRWWSPHSPRRHGSSGAIHVHVVHGAPHGASHIARWAKTHRRTSGGHWSPPSRGWGSHARWWPRWSIIHTSHLSLRTHPLHLVIHHVVCIVHHLASTVIHTRVGHGGWGRAGRHLVALEILTWWHGRWWHS